MTFEKGNIGYLLSFIVVGGILGSAVGLLVAKIFPALSILRENLTAALGFDLEIIRVSIRLNVVAIAGIFIGIVLFKKA
ncbi:MAG TPA: hypothetical protein PK544_04345 [Spirochaetota bacterium]|nr:hypothetical protein [Spirochaetota bacterium]HPJ39426.1 hypothetical protein [Spirochaetota bacterium]HPQ52792.1 hypothetical protein [Spirochaetota bacterium]